MERLHRRLRQGEPDPRRAAQGRIRKAEAARAATRSTRRATSSLEKEDEAKAVIAELKKGRKFEELAKQSKDPGSKDRGGDLDWNSPAGYVKPFGDAMVKLEKGKYTEVPVQTQFGWHVILVEDVRQAKFPTFDEIKPQLTERLQEQSFSRTVSDLRAKAKVE